MEESLQSRAEQLATEFASSATTIEELNGDGKPDVVLRHTFATTILVSTAVN